MDIKNQIEQATEQIKSNTSELADKVNKTVLDEKEKTYLLFALQKTEQNITVDYLSLIDENNTLKIRLAENHTIDKLQSLRKTLYVAMAAMFNVAAIISGFIYPEHCMKFVGTGGAVTVLSFAMEVIGRYVEKRFPR